MATKVYNVQTYAQGSVSWHGSKGAALERARELFKQHDGKLTVYVQEATTAPGLTGKALLVAALRDSGWSDKASWHTIWSRGPGGKLG